MRQSSHGVTTSCAAPLTPGKKYVAVQLLTKETLYCEVDAKAKVQHVFDQVCSYLGLKDAELFGLALLIDNEFLYLDTGIKLSKLASKTWKSQSNNGLDSIGRPLLTLHLSIKFYVDCPLLVRDKQTRHHYYLQLKGNFLQHCQACSEERCFLLAAYALQADFGNFNEERHQGRYFEPREYFPPWILGRLSEEYIVQNAPSIHKDYKSYSKGDAEMAFIKEASSSDAPHNLHVYKLKKKKNDLLGSIWLGICSRGIEIYENGGVNSRTKKLVSTFVWADIGKLCFEKKKFEIRAMSYSDTRKYTYYTGSDEKSKHLLYLCRVTHLFNLAIQPRVTELKRLELEEKKSYRESYIYSDSLDLEWEQEHGPSDMSLRDFNTLSKKGKVPNDQRTSVISNASSNTTSGIVSDRVQSLDGSEDEMDSAREPESPQPPVPPVEANNCVVLLPGDNSGAQLCLNGASLQPEPPVEVEQVSSSSMVLPRPPAPSTAVSNVDSVHSSSSDKSASTVRSRFSLVKSSIPSVPPAFSVPYLPHSSPQHSTSASDTYSSFDHSYTSSMDSSTAHMMPFLGGSQLRHLADSLNSASSTEDATEWQMDATRHPPGAVTRPTMASYFTATSKPSDLYLPPLPLRTDQACATTVTTRLSRKATPPTSSQSSNDESSPGSAPSSGLYHAMPMTCLNTRPTSLHINGVCMPHSVQHCRTKIGVSSLTRPANSGYGALALQRHGPPSGPNARFEALTNGGRYGYYSSGVGGHSNLLTLGKSISVPNVINENECLPISAAATYPPMTMPFSSKSSFYSNEALPAYPQTMHPPHMGLQDGLWPSVPDYYIKGPELSRGYSESPIPPPTDFAYIPPPPPYRNPQGSGEDIDSLSNFAPTLTPPRGFRQDIHTPVDGFLPTSTANVTKGPVVTPRTIFPTKAKSEENLLSQGMARSTGYIPPAMNGLHGNGLEEIQENKAELQFPAIPPPPPYGPEMPSNLSSPSSPDGSSMESLQRPKQELPEIQKLRERSRDLDLPLITALCNDRTLMSFSNALGGQQTGMDVRRLSYSTPVTPMKTTLGGRPFSWHVDSGSSLCDYNGLLTHRNYISCAPGAGTSVAATSILPPTPLTKWSSTNFVPKMVSPSTPPSTSIRSTCFVTHPIACGPMTSTGIMEWPAHAMVTSVASEHPGIPAGLVNSGAQRISALR